MCAADPGDPLPKSRTARRRRRRGSSGSGHRPPVAGSSGGSRRADPAAARRRAARVQRIGPASSSSTSGAPSSSSSGGSSSSSGGSSSGGSSSGAIVDSGPDSPPVGPIIPEGGASCVTAGCPLKVQYMSTGTNANTIGPDLYLVNEGAAAVRSVDRPGPLLFHGRRRHFPRLQLRLFGLRQQQPDRPQLGQRERRLRADGSERHALRRHLPRDLVHEHEPPGGRHRRRELPYSRLRIRDQLQSSQRLVVLLARRPARPATSTRPTSRRTSAERSRGASSPGRSRRRAAGRPPMAVTRELDATVGDATTGDAGHPADGGGGDNAPHPRPGLAAQRERRAPHRKEGETGSRRGRLAERPKRRSAP